MVPDRTVALTDPEVRWRGVDLVLAGYGALVSAICLGRLHQPGIPLVLAGHAMIPALAWLATRPGLGRVGRVLRGLYPVILLPALYSAIDVLNGYGAARTWDRPLQAIEAALFGGQPSRDWWREHPSRFWSTLLHATYFGYYVIVPLPLLVLLRRRATAAATRYLNAVITTFVLCYVCYILRPVAGPYYEFARPTGDFVANGAARLVYRTLASGSAFGAAFPSSHVAATVSATTAAWFELPWLGAVLLVPTVLLAVGVVYCQMHYAIDSITGIALGVAIPLAWHRRPTQTGAPEGRPRA